MKPSSKPQTHTLTPAERYPILASWKRTLTARNRAPRTIDHYLDTAARFLDFTGGEWDVSHRVIEEWVTDMLGAGSPHSANSRYRALQQFYKWLHAEDEVEANPMLRTQPPALEESHKDVLSLDDLARMLGHLRKQKRWRDAALIAVLVDTGLRASELANLQLTDVDLDNGQAIIRHTKTKTPRVVGLAPTTVELLDRYLRRRPESAWLIAGERGQLTRSGIYQIVRNSFREIGIEGIGPHDLRHTSASLMVAHMQESQMMAVFGWSSPKMVRHYAKQKLGDAALEAHRRASPMERLGR